MIQKERNRAKKNRIQNERFQIIERVPNISGLSPLWSSMLVITAENNA